MVEVEARFLLDAQQLQRVLTGAEFVSKEEYIVEFLDTKDWLLAFKNHWLKLKNGQKYELKVPPLKGMNGKKDALVTVFDEVTDRAQILKALGLEPQEDFEGALASAGIRRFANIKNSRTKYQKGPYVIDLDQAEFPLINTGETFCYSLAEVEIMSPTADQSTGARDLLAKFADDHGLVQADTRGKLMEFVYHNHPDVYKKFVEHGLITG